MMRDVIYSLLVLINGIFQQAVVRVYYILNIKMSAKSKKVELNEEFTAMWKEEQRTSGISCSLCIETKMKKTKV